MAVVTFLNVILGGPLRVPLSIRVAEGHHARLFFLIVHRWGRRGRGVIEHAHVIGRWGRGRSRGVRDCKGRGGFEARHESQMDC